MLLNAVQRNFDVGIIITEDQDFIPLIEAVKMQGRLVILWHLGCATQDIKIVADYDFDISKMFLNQKINQGGGVMVIEGVR